MDHRKGRGGRAEGICGGEPDAHRSGGLVMSDRRGTGRWLLRLRPTAGKGQCSEYEADSRKL